MHRRWINSFPGNLFFILPCISNPTTANAWKCVVCLFQELYFINTGIFHVIPGKNSSALYDLMIDEAWKPLSGGCVWGLGTESRMLAPSSTRPCSGSSRQVSAAATWCGDGGCTPTLGSAHWRWARDGDGGGEVLLQCFWLVQLFNHVCCLFVYFFNVFVQGAWQRSCLLKQENYKSTSGKRKLAS